MSKSPDALGAAAWRAFLTAHTILVEAIERDLARAELPPLGWYDVLFALEEAPRRRLRMAELSRAVVLSRSTLTRLVDRLEAAGLLHRAAVPGDRRGAYAVLSAEGAKLRRRMWPVYADCIQNHFARHIDAAEAKTLRDVFARLLGAVPESRRVSK
jgi:DNA-binding MarR family transcriptional regulator